MALFIGTVAAQPRAKAFHPWAYWSAAGATTLVGTIMADFADRSLDIGYAGVPALLFTRVY